MKNVECAVRTATSPNTAYTTHFVRPNFGFAETSYIPNVIPVVPNQYSFEHVHNHFRQIGTTTYREYDDDVY